MLLFAFSANHGHGQCTSEIPMFTNDKITTHDTLPTDWDTLASLKSEIFLLCDRCGDGAVHLASWSEDHWRMWVVGEWTNWDVRGQLQLLYLDGIPELVIYARWHCYDGGNGMGDYVDRKELWSLDGKRCYLDMIDKCKYRCKIPGETGGYVGIDYTTYVCVTAISKEGIEVKTNTTCGNAYKNDESGVQVCYDRVAKYRVGNYRFVNGKWILQDQP